MADHTCRPVGTDAKGEDPGQEAPIFHRWELVESAMHELAARSAVCGVSEVGQLCGVRVRHM